MAAELEADHTTGKNVYFQVRAATGTIWNGSAFEAYLTADIATYAITATEQGSASGYYTGTFPATAAAGVYNVVAKERAGVSPAESDRTVGVGVIEWDGSAVVPLSSRLPTSSYTAPLDAAGTRTAVGLASANLDTQLAALPTAAQTAAAVLAAGDVDGFSLEQTLKLCLAALAGKLSGAATTTITIRAADDSKARITATVDSSGNRSTITLDAAG